MTGYGGAKGVVEGLNVTVELKSVNNRYLDIAVRMPRNFLFAEDAVKSTIQQHVSRGKLDVFVTIDSSQAADTVLRVNEPLLRALREAFGDAIFRQDGSVDVHAIGLIVFKDRKKLAELDAIVHEHIPRALAQKMAATNAEIIGLDAIKLIESGLGAICDATVAVTAPEEVRVKRIMARDSITEEYARSRIAAQKDADYFRAQCDYEFVNDLPTAEKAEHAAEVYINTIINNLKEETER